MVLDHGKGHLLSAAFFCPQSKAPDEEQLAGLHQFLRHNEYGKILLEEASNLDNIWPIFANARSDVRELLQGPGYARMFRDWANNGESGSLSAARSGIVALPLLVILQVGQYLRYLEFHGISHQKAMADVQHAGGFQGYCGGLPSAIAIACGKNEKEVMEITAIFLRVLLGVGAYGEAADDTNGTGSTTLALRLKHEGQGYELASRFPGTYVSAVTDPRSVSIVGSAAKIDELFMYTRGEGFQVQKVDIRGKVHNPENIGLAAELCRLCHETPCLRLPETSDLRVPVRSNKSRGLLPRGSLIEEVVTTILASKCDWYSLLNDVADDLQASGRPEHTFVIFGLNDCVPMSPFHKKRLKTTKQEAHSLIQRIRQPKGQDSLSLDGAFFPDNAIAVIGASCRLPGANNLEELWDLLACGIDRHQQVQYDRFDVNKCFRALQSGNFLSDRKLYGNFIDDVRTFDNSFFGVNSREAANMDPQQRILLELSFEALEASGYMSKHRREAGDNVGCFIGASLVEYLDNTNAHAPTAYTSTGTIRAFLCGRLSHYYGWSGPAEVIDTACSSSLVAINRACKAIQAGECNMALTGGINIITGINNFLDLGKAGFLSPTGQCKPFDASADGYCRSDGAGLVVLKKLQQALQDGDEIWGVIPGIGTNQGGLSASITVPHSAAQQALYRNVLQQSGFQPEQVTYIEAHGTGTQAGDPLEMESVRSVFGSPSRRETASIGSIKGNIGHCETAAGVASLLKVLAMIKHGQIPPLANHQQLNPKIPPLHPDGLEITKNSRDWNAPVRAALVNSYGAAGSNCALLCCEMPRQTAKETESVFASKKEISFPIILSAASSRSLVDQARVLGRFLRRQGSSGLDVGDIAFTLNKRRRRHKHFLSIKATTTRNLADQLLEIASQTSQAFLNFPQVSKPVVLTFSGQSDNKVALDRAIYDTYPIFQSHIDACDTEIRNRGLPSIIPAIFQTQAIQNVVTLQCCMFAMQYACARCWIDAGLKISAIIGHSLGELTALAVSGALSLSDSIKLIASRAHLIESQWGPEKGAMLAINSGIQAFEKISSRLQTSSENLKLEIACYNAQESLVLVGTSAAIATAENLIKTDPGLQKIRYQRLETSHGFHSALLEPLISQLDVVSQSLDWHEPKIPVEFCTARPLQSIEEYSVSKHARNPVFFYNAVQRIEDSLGECLWLEGGINTTIIPMVRKASKQQEKHRFHAMKAQHGGTIANAVSNVIADLWGSGVSLTHWSFLPPHAQRYKQAWLPPYQFENSSHWRDNIDRTIEMQETLSNCTPTSVVEDRPPPPQLVTKKDTIGGNPGVAEFAVNTQSSRYRKLVGGHAVRQRPLCPASLYLECVVMAVQSLVGDMGNKSLVFENIGLNAALGLDLEGEAVVQVDALTRDQSWKFSLQSSCGNDRRSRQTSHGNGTIALDPNPMLEPFQRLIDGAIDRVQKKEEAERLMSKRAYGLFSLVVDYDHFFRGIHSITLDEWEAVATVNLPGNQPNREESTSWPICDTVAIDCFIQVVGLLMNSSDAVSNGEVMVMVGLERAVITPACNMDDPNPWQVYAKFCFTQDGQPIGDVFVNSPEGKLVAILCGCRFTKIQISKLEKVLDLANSTRTEDKRKRSRSRASTESSTTEGDTITPATTVTAQDANDFALRELIAEYTGVDEREIRGNAILADLGLDSLASVELATELFSKFELVITSDELIMSTLDDLNQRLPTSGSDSIRTTQLTSQASSSHKGADGSLDGLLKPESQKRHQQFLRTLTEVSGAELEGIEPSHTLAELGVDSLSLIDLRQELEETFSVRLNELLLEDTVQKVMMRLDIQSPGLQDTMLPKYSIPLEVEPPPLALSEALSLPNPFDALEQSDAHFDISANEQGFLNYWSDVAPFQDEILLAYIVEGFTTLGVNLSKIPHGSNVPQVPHLVHKYDKLVQRLWEILEKHDIVIAKYKGAYVRGNRHIDTRPSSQLVELFRVQFPEYQHEINLISLTGPMLANCLSGKADSVSIMFGTSASLNIMENFYSKSPMMSTLTEQLVIFIMNLLCVSTTDRPVRILEVGAGTGGTTKRLAEALDACDTPVQYIFTDISSTLVSKAKKKFKQYPWIDFATFNVEKDVPTAYRNRFDIVVSANCIHATSDRTASCRRLRDVLSPGGFIALSEVTRVIDWYDICFGLLDGWWLAEGRTAYPLQPAEAWMSTFKAAGFASSSYSRGPKAEANSQQLLIASNKNWGTSTPTEGIPDILSQDIGYRLETIVYKEVDSVQIHADVFFPRQVPSSTLPIALMIHGGGHMTLSRKAIRPMQTQHLATNGFLPVSIDYRLCPEVNLIEGPMNDVCDAYQWVRTTLPQIAGRTGIIVDASKVVIIGWSTGGHLAMSIEWTSKLAGIPPPTAVLSLYAPVDFESGELDSPRLFDLPTRNMSMERIISALPKVPITNYDSSEGDSTGLGWVRPGDPRSELVLSLFKEGNGLPLLLNGLNHPLEPPEPSKVAAISPLAQLRRGSYEAPTFIIHGTRDQVAPFSAAEQFVAVMKEKGIPHGFLPLSDVGHIHDLKLRPGTTEWETMVAPGYRFLFDIVYGRKYCT